MGGPQRYPGDGTAEMGSDGNYALIRIDNDGAVTVADDAVIEGDCHCCLQVSSPSTPTVAYLTTTSAVLREGRFWFSLFDAVDAIRQERSSVSGRGTTSTRRGRADDDRMRTDGGSLHVVRVGAVDDRAPRGSDLSTASGSASAGPTGSRPRSASLSAVALRVRASSTRCAQSVARSSTAGRSVVCTLACSHRSVFVTGLSGSAATDTAGENGENGGVHEFDPSSTCRTGARAAHGRGCAIARCCPTTGNDDREYAYAWLRT